MAAIGKLIRISLRYVTKAFWKFLDPHIFREWWTTKQHDWGVGNSNLQFFVTVATIIIGHPGFKNTLRIKAIS